MSLLLIPGCLVSRAFPKLAFFGGLMLMSFYSEMRHLKCFLYWAYHQWGSGNAEGKSFGGKGNVTPQQPKAEEGLQEASWANR